MANIYGLSDSVSMGNQLLSDTRDENNVINADNIKNMDSYTLANQQEASKRTMDDYIIGGTDTAGIIGGLRNTSEFLKKTRAYDKDGHAMNGWFNMAKDNISGGADPKEWLKNNKNVPMAEGNPAEDTFKSANVSDIVPASKGATAPSAKLSKATVSTPEDYVAPADPRTVEPLIVDSGDMIPRRSYATYREGKLFPLDPTGATISGAGAETDGDKPTISGQDAPQVISNAESGGTGRGPRPPTEPRPSGRTPSGQLTKRTPTQDPATRPTPAPPDRTGGEIVRSPEQPTSDGLKATDLSTDKVASGMSGLENSAQETNTHLGLISDQLKGTAGELVGKTLGNAGAVVDGLEGIDNMIQSKGHNFFDKDESGVSKAGDITQMAGAGLDFLSTALPFLAPLAIATTVAGGIIDSIGKIEGDKKKSEGLAQTKNEHQSGLAVSQAWGDMGMVASQQSDPVKQIASSSAF
jgi:hypothetical protein